tara:strand:- start:605 stop:829 length:225 start_codon:yes stop_codon:yes gene_type:complete
MPSETQSVVFPKDKWTLTKAQKWLRDNNYKETYRNKKVDITPTQLRFRQTPPSKYKSYTSKKLKNGVILVLGNM